MQLRDLTVKSGPYGASCACPVTGCRFFASNRYSDRDAKPRGFALNQDLRARVAAHMRAEHPDAWAVPGRFQN